MLLAVLYSAVSARWPEAHEAILSILGWPASPSRALTSIITASYGAHRASPWPHMAAHIALDMAIYMGRYMDNDQQPPWPRSSAFHFYTSLKNVLLKIPDKQNYCRFLCKFFFIFSIWCASIESEVSLSLVVSGADTSVITLPILTPCHVYCFLHHHHQRLIHYGKESHWKAKPPSSDDPGFCLVVADVQKLTVWSTDGLGPRNGRITWQAGWVSSYAPPSETDKKSRFMASGGGCSSSKASSA